MSTPTNESEPEEDEPHDEPTPCIHCGEPADDDETEMCDDCYAERNPDPNFVI